MDAKDEGFNNSGIEGSQYQLAAPSSKSK